MEYDEAYENSLHFSARFQEYVEALAAGLIERHGLRHKTIVEIGCGQGDFLRMLCAGGDNRGIGFDPAYMPEQDSASRDQRVEIVQDFYSEKYSDLHADFICCRHTLEHIPTPIQMLQMLRRAIGSRQDTTLFFEVPNALYTVRDLGIWDLIYEHCSYFTPQSLQRAFEQAGFSVQSIEPTFGEQFLCIEAVPTQEAVHRAEPNAVTMTGLTGDIQRFSDAYRSKVQYMTQTLARLQEQNQKVVVWGAGSKGVTFQNVLNTAETIQYVVDVNPRKHDMYVAGTGQQIVPPTFLSEYQPDAVIIMNAIYQDEIAEALRAQNVDAELILT
jgi:SAM-dependent methyltransferase